MKLSEAIRKGCEIAPRQANAALFKPCGRACALGAAILGAGLARGPTVGERYFHWRTRCGEQGFSNVFPYPFLTAHFHVSDETIRQIVEENDVLRIPREQIANSLEEAGL